MAKNEILQIVVFSVFVGTAVAALDDKAPAVLHLVEQAASIMLKVTEFVMKLAPFAIFAALASTIATQGLEMLGTYAKFVLGFYGSMGVLWILLFLAGAVVLGKRVIPLFQTIRTPALLAFSTASSEAAYPRILDALPTVGERFQRRPLRSQLIRDKGLGGYSGIAQKPTKQLQGRRFVPSPLDIQNLSLVIHRALQVHPSAADIHDHFVQMPAASQPPPTLAQIGRNQRSELDHPAPYRLSANDKPRSAINSSTSRMRSVKREQPDRLTNHGPWKAVPLKRY